MSEAGGVVRATAAFESVDGCWPHVTGYIIMPKAYVMSVIYYIFFRIVS